MRKEIEYYLLSNNRHIPETKDSSMKYCTKCKFVWDYWHQSGHYYFKKYSDMPTYKLVREHCRECTGKTGGSGRNDK
mgnify:CR=1 FL=1